MTAMRASITIRMRAQTPKLSCSFGATIPSPSLAHTPPARTGGSFAFWRPMRSPSRFSLRMSTPAIGEMRRIHDIGLFACVVNGAQRPSYRLRIESAGASASHDPYSFGVMLDGEALRAVRGESHLQPYDVLGAHAITHDGVAGVRFAVWAPNARRVSVVGPFNDWDGRRHSHAAASRRRRVGTFIPCLDAGVLYKYELAGRMAPCCR